jgi:hypothetical protein
MVLRQFNDADRVRDTARTTVPRCGKPFIPRLIFRRSDFRTGKRA